LSRNGASWEGVRLGADCMKANFDLCASAVS
jgi:hypothetical protein